MSSGTRAQSAGCATTRAGEWSGDGDSCPSGINLQCVVLAEFGTTGGTSGGDADPLASQARTIRIGATPATNGPGAAGWIHA